MCLKHFGYSSETTINALLEGNVPVYLEKYRDEEFAKSQRNPSIQISNDLVKDNLAVSVFSEAEPPFESEKEALIFRTNKKLVVKIEYL